MLDVVFLAAGLILTLGAAALGIAYPVESLAVSTNSAVRLGLSVCWLASGASMPRPWKKRTAIAPIESAW